MKMTIQDTQENGSASLAKQLEPTKQHLLLQQPVILILAIDPGGTTGLALGKTNDDGSKFSVLHTGELKLTPFELLGVLDSIQPQIVVSESFEFRQAVDGKRTGTRLDSRDLLGVCSMWTTANDRRYILQTPAQAKGSFPNSRLKQYGAYTVGSEHARDATRHLLYWAYWGKGSKPRVGIEGPES